MAQNVQSVGQEKVTMAIRQNEYPLAAIPSSFQARPQQAAAPQVDSSLFKLAQQEHKGMGWAQVVQKHNDEFHASGRVAKRRLDVPVEQLLAYCVSFFFTQFQCFAHRPLAFMQFEPCQGWSRPAGLQSHWPAVWTSKLWPQWGGALCLG